MNYADHIARYKRKQEAEAAAQRQLEQEEEQRLRLNFRLVESTLKTIVVPLFRDAARQIVEAGEYAHVEETKIDRPQSKIIVLAASLNAAMEVSTKPPQCYQSISYAADPNDLSFTQTISSQSIHLPLSQITQESVIAAIRQFISTL